MRLVGARARTLTVAVLALAVATLLLVAGWLQVRPATTATGSAQLVSAAAPAAPSVGGRSATQIAAAHRVPTANPFAHLGKLRANEVRLAAIGADFWPAQGATPKIGKQAAIAKASTGYSPLTTTTSTPDAVLVEYTNVFGLQAPDGTMTPSVPTQLAWLVKTSGMSAAGPVPYRLGGGSSTNPPQMFQCDFYVVTSAVDGSRIDAFRIC